MTPRDDAPEATHDDVDDDQPALAVERDDAVADWDAWRIKTRDL